MVDYGGLPLVAAWLIHALFVLVLATFPAGFAFAMSDVVSRFGSGGLLLAPAIWVTSELGRTYVFTGFPWMLLGYSQVPFLAVAQAASVVGVLGVSALVASVNATVAYVVTAETRARRTPVVATVVLVAGVLAFGEWRLQRSELTEAGHCAQGRGAPRQRRTRRQMGSEEERCDSVDVRAADGNGRSGRRRPHRLARGRDTVSAGA